MASQDVSTAKAGAYDWPAIIKDLLGTAFVSLLIMVPIVAYKSVITQYSLVLVSRWTEVHQTDIEAAGGLTTLLGFLERSETQVTTSAWSLILAMRTLEARISKV